MEQFTYQSDIPASAERLFRWHERPGAFERLNPPWAPAQVLFNTGGIQNGDRIVLKVPFGPFKIRWELEHRDYISGMTFSDVQLHGPFRSWKHIHSVEPIDPSNARLIDAITYAPPFGVVGRLGKDYFVDSELLRLFRYRHTIIKNDLALAARHNLPRPLRVLISGASGLIGAALTAFLGVAGHEVSTLVRRPPNSPSSEIYWNPEAGEINSAALEGFDAIIHLGGESVAAKRWSAEFKDKILRSRTQPTELLVKTISKLRSPPQVFLCASAIGFYGDRGSESLIESSPAGTGFLPEVAIRWEEEARKAEGAGARSAQLRFGVVLSPRGGALQKMLTPFSAGLGGILGDGSQFMSWIALDDVIGAIYHALVTDQVRGPINITAPKPVTNLEFTKTLGGVIGRPTLIPMPRSVIEKVFGEMGETLLLSSCKAVPSILNQTRYNFLFPNLDAALRHQLGKG